MDIQNESDIHSQLGLDYKNAFSSLPRDVVLPSHFNIHCIGMCRMS